MNKREATFVDSAAERVCDLVEHPLNGNRAESVLQSAAFALHKREQLRDQRQQIFLAAPDALEVDHLFRAHRPAEPHLEQRDVAADGVEGRHQLVAHLAEEGRLRAVREVGRVAQLPGLAIESLVVECEGAEIGEVRGERDLFRRERWVAFPRDEGDRPEHPRVHDERHD